VTPFSPYPEHRPRRPGPSAPRAAGRRPFGATWWGRAWTDALEQRARLDPNRLPRGRTYARSGAVGALTLAPGEIRAAVQGSRHEPYAVRVRVRAFSEDEWQRIFEALAAEIGHTAALLDGELPAEVAHDAAGAGLDLLPGAGELQPRCSCPDWADPCKHAAAVCYLVADELDTDPFGLLLLRGRSRAQVLAALRARRGQASAPATLLDEPPETGDAGLVATAAFARTVGPLPTLAPPPRQPGRPTVLGSDPPAGSGLALSGLEALAADAARRAAALLGGSPTSGLALSADEDLARRAAAALTDLPGATPDGLARLARSAGVPARTLFARALAWRDGGSGALGALEERFEPGPAQLAAGRALLGPGATGRANRVTLGERQLRLGRDGRWYRFAKDRSGTWLSDGPPLESAGTQEIGELEDAADRA
jgi:uncharacterized Zn finger protein